MNERIKQLLNEATSGHEQEYDTYYWITVSDKEMKKFAELIVRECAEIADTAEPFLASDLIKEHFGVKE